ncbi:MAG: hypothetical protein V3T70_03855, partial [Phycisphaerae bacterium]
MAEPDPQGKLRWQRIKRLFDGAVEVERSERGAWLAEQCGDDGELLAEVQALLDCDARTSPFLQPPMTPAEDEAELPDERDPQLGRRVGAYTLTRVIASGG